MQNIKFVPRTGLVARLLIGGFLLAILLFGSLLNVRANLPAAHADGGKANFALQPVLYDPSEPLTKSYFIFDSKARMVLNSKVRITNAGTAKGTASLYAVDATTGQTSGAVYLNQNDPRRDVGAWITLSMPRVVLAPGQSQVVAFQISIPVGARPGQHLGGIVAEDTTQESASQNNGNNTSTFQINVKNLTIIAVQVNLPGATSEQLTASGVRAGGANGYQSLLLGLSNTGTEMLKPSGSMQIADNQGQVLKNIALSLDTFLPQTAINYPVPVTGQALAAGNYVATLTLNYGNGQALHYTTRFTITQQQVAQVFSAVKTQAPPGLLGVDGLSSWIVMGGGLILLLIVGSLLYWFVLVPRARARALQAVAAPTRMSQFKKPSIR